MKTHIYALLTSERRRLGLSQQELAARAGVRREKVNRVESKGENISLDDLSRLLDALGLQLAVVEKDAPTASAPTSSGASLAQSERHLAPREFERASFIDGSKAKILSWSIGGAVMVALPKPFLAEANLDPGSEVDVSVENGAILLSPARPRYALKDLLARSDFRKRTPRAESEWQDAAPAGKEAI